MTIKNNATSAMKSATLLAILAFSGSCVHFTVSGFVISPQPSSWNRHVAIHSHTSWPKTRIPLSSSPRRTAVASQLQMTLKEPEVEDKVKVKKEEDDSPEKIRQEDDKKIQEEPPQPNPIMEEIILPVQKEMEKWEKDAQNVEFIALGAWLAALSSFIVINNFYGPWPASLMEAVPRSTWGLAHALSAMLFGGGIILTSAFEGLVTKNKNRQVLSFYFDKVPMLDAMIVLPALTVSMISGTGLAIQKYEGLGLAPPHVRYTLWCLTAFASWWAVTDLSTQASALEAIQKWEPQNQEEKGVPSIINFRQFSNVISCGFVVALYYIMVMKPGFSG